MYNFEPTNMQKNDAEKLVQHFKDNHHLVSAFSNQVLGYLRTAPSLQRYIHTLRDRIKDPEHLRDKVYRKMAEAKKNNTKFDINEENLFSTITDLAGIRILHLHTTQIRHINPILREIIGQQNLNLIDGPFARTWDDEYRTFFDTLGIHTQESPTMYTSVHYIVESGSRIPMTCEIQVRTLAEEIWGEVDHDINYPGPIDDVPCREQIRTLARATSTVTRLVDGIYASVDDLKKRRT